MPVLVQKFGGTSVADPSCIQRCAARICQSRRAGYDIVAVVSAMGQTTDALIALAHEINPKPSQREMDSLLATGEQASTALMTMALHACGVDAVSFAGHLLGIVTDPVHSKAKIRSIDAERIRLELAAGRVVVAAGFQGMSSDGQITTLGRGGSDTTAVAIAAALEVEAQGGGCEIYTDVDGVYTADPRQVPSARKIQRIGYEEMMELASLGAGIMHNRAVIFGQKYSVPIHVRHSARPGDGTMITKETPEMEELSVVGCALKPDLGRVTLRKVPKTPGVQAVIFRHIAGAEVIVDDIVQTEFGEYVMMSFTVEHQDLAEVKLAASKAIEELSCGELAVEVGLAKVSVVGAGMRTHSGVAAMMFKALGDAKIPIANITTSEIKISCIIPKEHGENALQVVHDAFGLGEEPDAVESKSAKLRSS